MIEFPLKNYIKKKDFFLNIIVDLLLNFKSTKLCFQQKKNIIDQEPMKDLNIAFNWKFRKIYGRRIKPTCLGRLLLCFCWWWLASISLRTTDSLFVPALIRRVSNHFQCWTADESLQEFCLWSCKRLLELWATEVRECLRNLKRKSEKYN